VAHALMETLGEPLMSSTLIPPGETIPLNDPFEIEQQMGHALDLIVDGGHCGVEATTVVDMIDGLPKVVRVGCGDPSPFE